MEGCLRASQILSSGRPTCSDCLQFSWRLDDTKVLATLTCRKELRRHVDDGWEIFSVHGEAFATDDLLLCKVRDLQRMIHSLQAISFAAC